MSFWILAINPGSTSTKLAIYDGDSQFASETLRHDPSGLASAVADQLDQRTDLIKQWLDASPVADKINAVVGRGGLLKPISSGTYAVNDAMIEDLHRGVQGEHASNLGGLIAHKLAEPLGVPAYIVDPVAVDEFIPEARISGIPEISRRSLSHALNIKAVAHRAARDLGQQLADINMIVVHLGGGISVAPLRGGRMVDVNNANEGGPFSPERTGGLPVGDVVKMAYSGRYTEKELLSVFTRKGGLLAYLGTNDGQEIASRIADGDEQADLVFRAMAYQVAKEVGAMAAVLCGKVRAVVLTGGLAHSELLTGWIKDRVRFVAPVLVFPGEDEMQALAEGALRVLTGAEKPQEYN